MHLIDSDGNRYLDGVSSLWCNVHGHRVPEIDNAIRRQLDRVAHSTMLGLANEPATLLADRLIKIVPPNLKKVFYSDAGATATEIAFKLAVQYWHNIGQPDKREFIAFDSAYHGDTFGAISVGRTELFHRPFLPMMFKSHVVRDLDAVQSLLNDRAQQIAAIVIEPIVQGAAGIRLHPPGLLASLRETATKHDVLLICDEVATGFGRTGKMFAVEHEHVQPDLMCVGKGLTGGYLPLAATFTTQSIFDAFLGEPSEGKTFYHGHTYTGNPLACAAAIASLDLFDKSNLIASVQYKSVELSAMLDQLRDDPHVAQVRQKGFMVGIDLVSDQKNSIAFDPKRRVGAEICNAVRRHGVILRPLGDTLVIMPPLAMELDDLHHIVDAVKTELRSLSC